MNEILKAEDVQFEDMDLVTVDEAAQRLGVSKQYVYDFIMETNYPHQGIKKTGGPNAKLYDQNLLSCQFNMFRTFKYAKQMPSEGQEALRIGAIEMYGTPEQVKAMREAIDLQRKDDLKQIEDLNKKVKQLSCKVSEQYETIEVQDKKLYKFTLKRKCLLDILRLMGLKPAAMKDKDLYEISEHLYNKDPFTNVKWTVRMVTIILSMLRSKGIEVTEEQYNHTLDELGFTSKNRDAYAFMSPKEEADVDYEYEDGIDYEDEAEYDSM